MSWRVDMPRHFMLPRCQQAATRARPPHFISQQCYQFRLLQIYEMLCASRSHGLLHFSHGNAASMRSAQAIDIARSAFSNAYEC